MGLEVLPLVHGAWQRTSLLFGELGDSWRSSLDTGWAQEFVVGGFLKPFWVPTHKASKLSSNIEQKVHHIAVFDHVLFAL